VLSGRRTKLVSSRWWRFEDLYDILTELAWRSWEEFERDEVNFGIWHESVT